MKIFFNNSFLKDLLKKKYFKLFYFYGLIFISLLLIFLLTIINTKAPFFAFSKDERVLKNVNHFYPQNFPYFTARPDSLIFVEAYKVTKDNHFKKINTSLSHSSNYFGLSRKNKFNYQFFGNIYLYISDENEYTIDDASNLKAIPIIENDFIEMAFGESYFCGKYVILLRNTIPIESKNTQNNNLLSAKYKLVNIKCK